MRRTSGRGIGQALVCACLLTAGVSARAQPAEPEAQPEPVDLSRLEESFEEEPGGASGAGSAGADVAPGSAKPARVNPEISLIASFAGAYFSSDDHLQTGGHDPTETGFNLQALELSLGAAVDPYFRFDSYLVFGLFGVEVEEAYATTLDMPAGLQLRLGQFLTRFGRHNARHLHAWVFADQPFMLGRVFGGEGSRGLGLEASWLTPLPWYLELVLSATMPAGEGTARSFYGADDVGVESPVDLVYTTALEQFFPLSPNWSLAWGLSGAFGPNSTGRGNRTEVYGTDLYFKYRPITRASYTTVGITFEYLYRRRQLPDQLLQDFGGYTQVFWQFARRWSTAVRHEYGSPAMDTSFTPSAADPLDPNWTDSRHRATAMLAHSPSEFSRFRLQGSRDFPLWRDGVWAAFLTAELVTGAHGAHQF